MSVGPLAPVVQPSTAALIADRLREAIATGVLAPGEQLTEATLAGAFGVSRGPLREAMQRLTQEGLLVGHRNRGLFVLSLDDAEIADIYLAREAVERAAIEQVVAGGRAEEAVELVRIAERMGTDDVAAVTRADTDFHVTLVRLSASPRLQAMHATLITQVRMCLTRLQGTYTPSEGRVEEHLGIARAVQAGDVPGATALLHAHMRDGLRRLAAGAVGPPA